MKFRFILMSLLLGFYFQAESQIEKGMVLIGNTTNFLGNFNTLGAQGFSNNAGLMFGKQKVKYEGSSFNFESETNITSFNLSPTAGVFASDNILVGASVGFWIYRLKDEDDDKDGVTVTSFAPFVRGYFKTEGKALPFAEVKGGLLNVKQVDSDDPADNLSFFSAKIGGSFFVGKRTSIDLFLDYNYSRSKDEEGSETATNTISFFGAGVGLSIYLGQNDKDD